MNTTTDARVKQVFNSYDPWKNPIPDDAPEPEPVDLPSDCECARREVERVSMRGKNFLHTLRVIKLFAKEGTTRKEIYRRARREYDRNRRILQSGLVRYERLNETPATVRIAPVARAVARPVSGHAPRAARRDARSASSTSTDDSSDGSDGPSDQPETPSLPLAYGNIDKRRNGLHSENFHCNELSSLIDKLQLESAALMCCALASLIAGATR